MMILSLYNRYSCIEKTKGVMSLSCSNSYSCVEKTNGVLFLKCSIQAAWPGLIFILNKYKATIG